MAGTFNLQIVTPEREVYNAPVESVSLPGMQSPFGVLRNHAPLVAALEPGVVHIVDAEIRDIKLVIGGGFFQVAKNQAILLADSAEFPHEISIESAQAEEQHARSRLEGKFDAEQEEQRKQAEAALKHARIRQRAAGG